MYGANTTLPKTEEMVLKPLTPYAASKMAGEALSLAYANTYEPPVTTFRFFNIFLKNLISINEDEMENS